MVRFSILPVSSGTAETFDLPEDTVLYIYPSNVQITVLKRKLFYVQCRPSFVARSNKGEKFKREEDAQKRASELREELKVLYEDVKKNGGFPMTLKELKALPEKMLHRNVRIAQHPLRTDEVIHEEPLQLHPYWLGAWCGDGNQIDTGFTSADNEIVNWMTNYAESLNLTYRKQPRNEMVCNKAWTYHVPRSVYTVKRIWTDIESREKFAEWYTNPQEFKEAKCWTYNEEYWWTMQIASIGKDKFLTYNKLRKGLVHYNLICNKRIPQQFLRSSRWVRLAVLSGLIDTDGYLSGNMYEISQKRDDLSADIISLCQSLGFFAKNQRTLNKTFDPKGVYYNRMMICGLSLDDIPILIKRKKSNIFKSSQIYLPRLSFKIKENVVQRRRSPLHWRKGEEDLLTEVFERHGSNWAKIVQDPDLESLVQEKKLSKDNVRNKCKKMRLE